MTSDEFDVVEAVRQIMLDNPAIYAVIGARIYPMGKPLGGTLPEASYKRVSEVVEWGSGVKTVRLQITVIDDDYSDVLKAARIIRGDKETLTGIDGYSGEKLGVKIKSIAFMNQTDDNDRANASHRESMSK